MLQSNSLLTFITELTLSIAVAVTRLRQDDHNEDTYNPLTDANTRTGSCVPRQKKLRRLTDGSKAAGQKYDVFPSLASAARAIDTLVRPT